MEPQQPLSASTPESEQPVKHGGELIWNFLTILLLLAVAAVLVVAWLIYSNPYTPLNRFQPPTMPAAIVLPSATPTAKSLPSTWTATLPPTEPPTITPSPLPPTTTPVPETPTPEATYSPAPTQKVDSKYPFVLQSDPSAIAASVLYPDRGCKWLGIGGQVLDVQGRPAAGISVQVGGNLNGRAVNLTSLTGLVQVYGLAGYEIPLAETPVASKGTLWVRLWDQAGLPLSDKVSFETYDDCSRNLIVVNFKAVR